ncbi:MAG: protein kinase domain-containing protein [Thermoanaerobaculia bacterium]
MALALGTRLGPYEILATLGAGGMGEVYRARDTRLGREVAVKVLPEEFAADPDRLRRFEQEARAASALNHPNILTIHDIGTHQGAPYVVSELLEGETLRDQLGGVALSPRKAIEYMVQIAHGLAAAHERGIVHRDLKPENLFVTKDGRAKILDFGLAKLTRPETGSSPLTQAPTLTAGTEPGVVMGTVGYMSPEQVRGLSLDSRSDIFSFGAILYEMLAGRRAFRGISPADTMSAILKEEPEFSPTHPGASPALEHIVRRCLEKSPEERFQSARDLAFALREISSDSDVPRPVSLPVSRPRSILWLAPLGLVVLLAVLIAVNVGGLRERLSTGGQPARIQSLAVLPLENLSRDTEQEYFADGMTEELISDLGKIRALRVISRTSAMRYKGTKKSMPEIARELNVDALVEGSVLRAGDRVRITAQLIHAATDRHLWSESYERDLKDVLALQSEVARAVAREVKIALTPQEQARFAEARPVDPEAHQLYLKGRYYVVKNTQEAAQKALECFQQAIDKDPAYAEAYAQLANSYAFLGYTGLDVLPARETMPKAKAAVLKALELDDTLAEAHTALGLVRWAYDWDWAAAEKEFQRAIELNPGYATAHLRYGNYFCSLGRFDAAIAEDRRALELDPLSLVMNHVQGWPYHLSGRYDQAIERYRKTLEMDPNFARTHLRLGEVLAAKGLYREAIGEYEKFSALGGGSTIALALIGNARALAGERREALRTLEELTAESKRSYVPSFHFAIVHMGLGDKDQAFAWLDKAYEERSQFLVDLKFIPILDPLRSDPRFADLVRRVGLPP